MKQVKRYNFFWICLKKRWSLQQNLQQFTVYWPLAQKPRASVYFEGDLSSDHTQSVPAIKPTPGRPLSLTQVREGREKQNGQWTFKWPVEHAMY